MAFKVVEGGVIGVGELFDGDDAAVEVGGGDVAGGVGGAVIEEIDVDILRDEVAEGGFEDEFFVEGLDECDDVGLGAWEVFKLLMPFKVGD